MFLMMIPRRVAVTALRSFPTHIVRGSAPQMMRAISTTASSKLQHSQSITNPNIKVTHFEDGKRVQENVEVDVGAAAPIVAADVPYIASGLQAKVREALPTTIKNFTLAGKTAIVSGGARGLGLNMAQALAEAGVDNIALIDVNEEAGVKAAQDLQDQTGVKVIFVKVDLRNDEDIQAAVTQVAQTFGGINVLVNSAGIAESNIPAELYDGQAFRKTIDVNLIGCFVLNQAVAREMIKGGEGGSIVNIASMSGTIVNYPQPQCAYNASKAAVIMLTKCLAAEWAPHAIRVNTISPGYMDTALNRVPALDAQKKIWVAQTPQKRLGAVSDLNGLAVYLASDASAYMTGSDSIIDGGYTVW
ncbi:unnamed protein product [Zymoseptoria tritici ST99CH_1A5]|nr:unnamed protein product [Zymoseptoria tritici ST99CH_1A5]